VLALSQHHLTIPQHRQVRKRAVCGCLKKRNGSSLTGPFRCDTRALNLVFYQ